MKGVVHSFQSLGAVDGPGLHMPGYFWMATILINSKQNFIPFLF